MKGAVLKIRSNSLRGSACSFFTIVAPLASTSGPRQRAVQQARALVFGDGAVRENTAWFFAVYPGSLMFYWLWLSPRKVPMYLPGRAPRRRPSSMRPTLEIAQTLLGMRTSRIAALRKVFRGPG